MENKPLLITVLLVTYVVVVGASICKHSQYFDGEKQVCLPCRTCLANEVQIKNCTESINRLCFKCPNGTYIKDNQCTNCSKCQFGTVRECSVNTDAVCIPKKRDSHGLKQHEVATISVVVVVVFVIFVAVFAIFLCKEKRRNQEPQAENGANGDNEADEADELQPIAENGNIK